LKILAYKLAENSENLITELNIKASQCFDCFIYVFVGSDCSKLSSIDEHFNQLLRQFFYGGLVSKKTKLNQTLINIAQAQDMIIFIILEN
jgi:hypothetical protein